MFRDPEASEAQPGVCIQRLKQGSVFRGSNRVLYSEAQTGVCAQRLKQGSVSRGSNRGLCPEAQTGVCSQRHKYLVFLYLPFS